MADAKKVALITGANKGLGFEMARQLGKEGYLVVLGARTADKANEAAGKLRDEGIDAHSITLDVTDAAQVEALPGELGKRFGRLDALVNNAGIFVESWGGNQTSRTPLAKVRETFETNFFGVVTVTQALLPLLRESPAGRIVNLSSIMGSLAIHADPKGPLANMKPFGYDASKAALNAFTVHLAAELRGTNIKVNSAHPGWVQTDLGGSAAPMGVEEGARTGVTLATLPESGPTGGFFHAGKPLPW